MKSLTSIGLALAAGLLSTGSAHAGIIYDNGGPNQVGNEIGDNYTASADEFTLIAGANTIGGVN